MLCVVSFHPPAENELSWDTSDWESDWDHPEEPKGDGKTVSTVCDDTLQASSHSLFFSVNATVSFWLGLVGNTDLHALPFEFESRRLPYQLLCQALVSSVPLYDLSAECVLWPVRDFDLTMAFRHIHSHLGNSRANQTISCKITCVSDSAL